MKHAQTQDENVHPLWWINNLDAHSMKSDLFKKLVIDQSVRGCIVKLETIADLIGFSPAFDVLMQENHALSSKTILAKVLYHNASHIADTLLPLYQQDRKQGLTSVPLLPLIFPDGSALSEGLRVFNQQIQQENVLLQLPAIPENMAHTKGLLLMGKSIHFTDVMATEQVQIIFDDYLAAISARITKKQDVAKIRLVLSAPVCTGETASTTQTNQATAQTSLPDQVQRLYEKLQGLQNSAELQSLMAVGANTIEMIWTDILPGNGAFADAHYVVSLPVHSTFEADLHQAARIMKSLSADEKSTFQSQNNLQPEDDAQRQQSGFYERRRKQIEHALERADHLIQEKEEQLKQSKESFQIHNSQVLNLDDTVAAIVKDDLISRIWQHDFTVWKPQPDEIVNRLGWLHCPQRMLQHLKDLQDFVAEIIAEKRFTQVILCGMGGSSLAPEVFEKTFGVKPDYLELSVLDSTDPAALHALEDKVNLESTLFIVSTKSGSTIETVSMMKYFYHRLVEKFGAERAGEHFVAITDPGSSLIRIAEAHHFRKIFINDPNIGGRYSVLSYFGLVPAALIGIDLQALLENARGMQTSLSQFPGTAQHVGLMLGAVLGQSAQMGRDKLTFVLSPAIERFGIWVEQLIAESTGKEGKGILPVVGEKLLSAQYYQDDRMFVYLHLNDDQTHTAAVQALIEAGFPVIEMECESIMALGSQYFLWEFATALAGSIMGIQPFDQPNVEYAKVYARKMVADYQTTGSLTASKPAFQEGEISVFGDCSGNTLREILAAYLSQVHDHKYCAIQAYLPPMADVSAALADIQNRIHTLTHCAVTVGLGPRYLHSTGQLHKGDSGNGVFIQITSDPLVDLMIPQDMDGTGESIRFGILKLAAALGDQIVLREGNRPVLQLHLGTDVFGGLQQIALSLPK